jgi:hypothetical protein
VEVVDKARLAMLLSHVNAVLPKVKKDIGRADDE